MERVDADAAKTNLCTEKVEFLAEVASADDDVKVLNARFEETDYPENTKGQSNCLGHGESCPAVAKHGPRRAWLRGRLSSGAFLQHQSGSVHGPECRRPSTVEGEHVHRYTRQP